MKNDKASKRKAKYGSILGGDLPGAMPKGKPRKTASNGMKVGVTYKTLKKMPKMKWKVREEMPTVSKYKGNLRAKGHKKGTGY